jgi:hypothetical protein
MSVIGHIGDRRMKTRNPHTVAAELDRQCYICGIVRLRRRSQYREFPDNTIVLLRLLERRHPVADGEFDERRQVFDAELLHCPCAIGSR